MTIRAIDAPAIVRRGTLGFTVLPVGRMSCDQMRGLAAIADRHGSGTIRLTVWQNLLISDIPREEVEAALREIEELGLAWRATDVRAAMIGSR